MEIKITRQILTDESTIGTLEVFSNSFNINSKTEHPIFRCFTLEDKVREGEKIAGKTAIQKGRYELVVNYSQRFKQQMPLLLNVPNFEGVRIHMGNDAGDTEGCILVGLVRLLDTIMDSRLAYQILLPLINEKLTRGKVYLTIE